MGLIYILDQNKETRLFFSRLEISQFNSNIWLTANPKQDVTAMVSSVLQATKGSYSVVGDYSEEIPSPDKGNSLWGQLNDVASLELVQNQELPPYAMRHNTELRIQ